jgi:hypothetical protein
MKRDMELVRKILFALEALDDGFAPNDFAVPGYDDDVVAFHAHPMGQAGLLDVSNVTVRKHRGPAAIPNSITCEGYEFLNLARDDARWNRTMGTIKSAAGSVSVAVLAQVLGQYAKAAILGQ